eukprot:3814771-Pyramimonas_sp.AAC.1
MGGTRSFKHDLQRHAPYWAGQTNLVRGRLRSHRMHSNVLARQLACGPTFPTDPPFAASLYMVFAVYGRRRHASSPFPPDSK